MNIYRNLKRTSAVLTLTLVGHVAALPALAQQASAPRTGAQLSMTGNGEFKIDGTPAVTGATVFSGSRLSTGAGATGVVTLNGTRLMLNENTDGVLTFGGSSLRFDVVCGSASGSAATGGTVEILTQADTNVHAQAAGVRVAAEGKSVDLLGDEQQSYLGSTRIMVPGGSSVEFATVNCSCMCAAPAVFPAAPIIAGGFPLLGLIALLAGGTAAVVTPIILTDDNPQTPPEVSRSSF